ncbi:endolytic transglycosylase MltG, partial [Treponema sp. R6D11]
FKVPEGASYGEILKSLKGSPVEMGTKIVIPEGYENRQIAELLQEKGLVNADEFLRVLDAEKFDYSFLNGITRTKNKLEGYLFPATYTIPAGSTSVQIAKKMLDAFALKWQSEYTERARELGYSIDQIVTLASIVEREAVGESDRDKVASVFLNRLKNKEYGKLES